MGTHEYENDPRNENVLISINGEMFPRGDAKVSVFDSGFLLGDGVWESFRLHNGTLVFLEDHLDRLFHGADALSMDPGRSRGEISNEIMRVVQANGMHDEVHLRLILSRGLKPTPYQAPWVISSPPTMVIIPEYKRANPQRAVDGISLVTVDIRRGSSEVQDPRINSLSKHNCIAACIDAASKGGEEGLMLDPHGFVSTCNSTHFFMVKDGEVWTSTGEFCLDGITRRKVLGLCQENGIPSYERNFDLSDVRSADEAFVTGTFAGLTPVVSFDGEPMSDGSRGPLCERLQGLYIDLVEGGCGD
ncbi:MAG TPA: aminotransferase class IV [Candidatus Thalassarchaeaceae archaeon]|jgi:branched-chain amino acid aminotransferase|nr:aminotransferase class IV [Candidatus Thalassarchaeaceae archaeon]MDP7649758.1 aminotransferase class IV [Candidatus Thalassarchaeaceae archaeon]HJL55104.1 aminotransferase class IV [Candidatus Thalassarchaeaceae archaeon]HJM77022.1 aminotransferase class IV [Candidatus Thalassarchaeaceae archaeon]HJO84828.1 aminotransferase class IV [Candidatus Thalassarchaeaceae archaeon]|tara:strand:- start:596 stop:1504 length:909 start_codon:yes stop_codon:yes gene_type:complete